MQIVKVETTVGNDAEAEALVALILERRLAACIQCEPIRSHYRWQGRLAHDDEVRLSCKTSIRARDGLVTLLQEHHSYDVPEIVVQVADVSDAYGAWLHAEVSHEGA